MTTTEESGVGRLAGKVVVVAGASSGMGRATALACAREGADVAVVARRGEALEVVAAQIRALGRRAMSCPADLTDPSTVENAFALTVEQLGPLDVVVITAGTNIRARAQSVVDWGICTANPSTIPSTR